MSNNKIPPKYSQEQIAWLHLEAERMALHRGIKRDDVLSDDKMIRELKNRMERRFAQLAAADALRTQGEIIGNLERDSDTLTSKLNVFGIQNPSQEIASLEQDGTINTVTGKRITPSMNNGLQKYPPEWQEYIRSLVDNAVAASGRKSPTENDWTNAMRAADDMRAGLNTIQNRVSENVVVPGAEPTIGQLVVSAGFAKPVSDIAEGMSLAEFNKLSPDQIADHNGVLSSRVGSKKDAFDGKYIRAKADAELSSTWAGMSNEEFLESLKPTPSGKSSKDSKNSGIIPDINLDLL